MRRIDAHQHFWKFDPARDNWINDNMAVIKRDFLPANLETVLKNNGFDGSVVIQSSQNEEENSFQLANASANSFIKAIVGWVDLKSKEVEKRLEDFSRFEKVKGFRHVLQGEADRAYMLNDEFMRGVSFLNKYKFTYDILILPDQLPYAAKFVASFPEQKFVIDHIAKPGIKSKEISNWRKDMQVISGYDNVYCKISGMVTEADWKNWQQDDFVPYLDTVVNAFGTSRVIYGSDWPVCLVAASYEKVLAIVERYFENFSQPERDLFFGGNAIEFYNL